MKKILLIAFSGILLFSSCDGFLDYKPNGTINEEILSTPEQVDNLVIAAYSMLGNDDFNTPFSLWNYGNVRSDDAYKGGADASDGQDLHFFELGQNVKKDSWMTDGLWFNLYVAISRTNSALRSLNDIEADLYAQKAERIGEMRFLRGHFYFMLKELFKRVPYIDEHLPIADYDKVSNTALDNTQLWQKIADDFKAAYDALPKKQLDKGRPTRYTAAAYLAKTKLYKAFEQDDSHTVVNINRNELEEVLTLTQEVIQNSPYKLEPDFAFNFLPGQYENGVECLFAVQYSENDGTKFGRLNWSDALSSPQIHGCCDFNKPSQNLVNAFKTQNGLPVFDDYNSANYDPALHQSDPRLFHTVAMPGFPYKYSSNPKYIVKADGTWNRNIPMYGTFSSLKENVEPECDCLHKVNDTYMINSKNRAILRLADVILFRAEALIELGRHAEALPLINQLRTRAQKSTALIGYAPNLSIATYEDGVNCTWTPDYARKALRWERRMELAMEGSRYFDLTRWGVADEVMNAYFTTESRRRTYLGEGRFTKSRNEYLPIPQQQINFSQGIYQQNTNW